ncbi:hypothetical protein FSP39_022941 [Pinctada imbricata]|uniref:Formin GTPase-binding domain-containing protein n=1 Tax=Pinctada imbricata TaxID=66713 RepID=A0AA89CCC5_PINIB|nr:hypothetical protein FSP39_022941 [Pinctada imbricata]
MSTILRFLRRTASRLSLRKRKRRRKNKSRESAGADVDEVDADVASKLLSEIKQSPDGVKVEQVEVHMSRASQEAEIMENQNQNGKIARSDSESTADSELKKSLQNGDNDGSSSDSGGKDRKWNLRDKIKFRLMRREISDSDPDDCVEAMKFPTVHKFAALKKKLKNANVEWIQSFLDNGGLDVLLDCVDEVGTRRVNQLSDALLLLECVSCIKKLVNNKSGLGYLVQHGLYTQKLVKGMY